MNCSKCGCAVPNGSTFCPFCGTPLEAVPSHSANVGPVTGKVVPDGSDHQAESSSVSLAGVKEPKKKWKNYVGVLLLLSVAGWGYFHFVEGPRGSETEAVSASQSKDPLAKWNGSKGTAETGGDSLHKAQAELEQHGLKGTLIATTYGHNKNGFLSIAKTNDGSDMEILVWDSARQRVGMVHSFTPGEINQFVTKGGNGRPNSIRIYVAIPKDDKDQDEGAGNWYEGAHMMPIYASYKLLPSGEIEPGKLTTAKGMQPSHFQTPLYEQKNVDLINLFLTEMPTLKRMAFEKKIDLSGM